MDTTIRLGTFVFKDFEIPEQINFGGTHQLAQHDLIGGNRVVDAMGKNDMDIAWHGRMQGPDALTRAQQLNQLRTAGKPLTLTWFNLNYQVIIQNFVANTERYYQVTYDISLRVITDGATPVANVNPVGFNEAIKSDLATANAIAANLNFADVNAVMNAVTQGVEAIQIFDATQQAITTLNNIITNATNLISTRATNLGNNLWSIAKGLAGYGFESK